MKNEGENALTWDHAKVRALLLSVSMRFFIIYSRRLSCQIMPTPKGLTRSEGLQGTLYKRGGEKGDVIGVLYTMVYNTWVYVCDVGGEGAGGGGDKGDSRHWWGAGFICAVIWWKRLDGKPSRFLCCLVLELSFPSPSGYRRFQSSRNQKMEQSIQYVAFVHAMHADSTPSTVTIIVTTKTRPLNWPHD